MLRTLARSSLPQAKLAATTSDRWAGSLNMTRSSRTPGRRTRTLFRLAAVLITVLFTALGVQAQSAPAGAPASYPPPAAPGASAPSPTPSLPQSDVDRVRAGLSRSSTLNLRDDRLRYYTETDVAAPQTFATYLGDENLWDGAATKGGNPMTHQEFLNMVTPKELYGSGGIQAIGNQYARTHHL